MAYHAMYAPPLGIVDGYPYHLSEIYGRPSILGFNLLGFDLLGDPNELLDEQAAEKENDGLPDALEVASADTFAAIVRDEAKAEEPQ